MSGFITTLVLIAYEFFKTGLFTNRRRPCHAALLLDIAERYPHWYTTQTVMDMIAISESTPALSGSTWPPCGGTASGVLGLANGHFFPSFCLR